MSALLPSASQPARPGVAQRAGGARRAAGQAALHTGQHKGQQKGLQTRAAIVDAALALATQIGLEGLSIGALAGATGMSKSGVFAHFGAREELQICVLREYHARFEQEVFYPALAAARGVPRLTALFDNWMRRSAAEIDSGCIYISGAVEFDERSGPVRAALTQSVLTWHAALLRAIGQCQELGQLRSDIPAGQVLFEIHGLILALHYEARFLRNPHAASRARAGFQGILARYGSAASGQTGAGGKPRRASKTGAATGAIPETSPAAPAGAARERVRKRGSSNDPPQE